MPGIWFRALVIAATDMDGGRRALGWLDLACAREQAKNWDVNKRGTVIIFFKFM